MTPEQLTTAMNTSKRMVQAQDQVTKLQNVGDYLKLDYFTKDQIEFVRTVAMSIAEKNLKTLEKEFKNL